MRKYRQIQRRRTILYLIDWLVLILFLSVWSIMRHPAPPERTIAYSTTRDSLLVQLAKLPEPDETGTSNVLLWTLYGDGTLIFRTDPDDTMWQAHLVPSDMEAILQVIIQRDAFFTSTASRYGSTTSHHNDDDERLLTVAANGQHKQVLLQGKPATWATSDTQTGHVFAIEAFLLAYHPVHRVLAAPNPDPDRLSHETD